MNKALVAGIVGLGLLVGCGANIPTQMNIEASSSQSEYLMGEITRAGGFGLSKINFKADSLKKSCKGQSLNGEIQLMSNGLWQDSYKHKFPITCSDGSTGLVMLQLTIKGASGVRGTGYGKMDDGSVVKISVGETSGGIDW
ncbi:hypothetical protein OAC62_01755 [Amylibacter sp.]|nr:hypothetical protein [Amylibacter sp.]